MEHEYTRCVMHVIVHSKDMMLRCLVEDLDVKER